jgi:hypothetical protein
LDYFSGESDQAKTMTTQEYLVTAMVFASTVTNLLGAAFTINRLYSRRNGRIGEEYHASVSLNGTVPKFESNIVSLIVSVESMAVAYVVKITRSIGLKRNRLLLVVLTMVSGLMAASGVDLAWCIAFIVVVYSLERGIDVILAIQKIKRLNRQLDFERSQFRSFIDSERGRLMEELSFEKEDYAALEERLYAHE